MTNPSHDPNKIVAWLRSRGVLFRSAVIAVASIALLFAGSQIAHDRGQTVDWYTGFGQWLGALGSFIAAGAALWISMSDRRSALADRQHADGQREADARRQAGLVRVTAEILNKRQPIGPGAGTASIGIRNRRSERIFDIEVVKVVHHGDEIELKVAQVNGFAIFPLREERRGSYQFAAEFDGVTLEPDEWLVIYQPPNRPNTTADYASVRYTDTAGRRWEVDTDGAVTRL